jgi:GNAT superfamily N-acetyltransferase
VPVRTATELDADALADVYVRSWQAAYGGLMPDHYLDGMSVSENAASWRRSIPADAARGKRTLIFEDGDRRISGVAAVGADKDTPAGILLLLYVAPEAWGGPAGHELMLASEEAMRDLGHARAVLWVLVANARARRFYERGGWLLDGATSSEDYGGVELPALRYTRNLRAAGA